MSATELLPERTVFKYRLRALYQEAVLACVRHRVARWWDRPGLENIFCCDTEARLRRLLSEVILREAQDLATYRHLSRQLDALAIDGRGDCDATVMPTAAPTHPPGERDYPPSSTAAMMNGLLSLHMAETFRGGETLAAQTAALREVAREIWESGCAVVTATADAEHLHQIVRMLSHFDLLPEARDCLARYAPQGAHACALDDWMRLREVNADCANQLIAQGYAGDHAYVVGITVWGHDYLDFFCDYHLPSLLAPGNLPALAAGGKLVVSIVTDAAGKAGLESHAALLRLATFAHVHYTVVDSVPGRASAQEARTFYMRYGLLEHHHVYLARDLRANLLLMPTDTIISKQGYASLAREIQAGYDCCTIACIEARRAPVCAALDALRQEGVISVDAAPLMAIAVRHKTDYFNSLIVDPSRRLNAHPREFFWRVPGGYVCHSLFMHPIMLSARVLARAFHPNHENVDWALLPRVMQGGGRVKVLDDASELFILHCSEHSPRDADYAPHLGHIMPELAEYLLSIHEHDFPLHRELFRHPQFFPVEDGEVALARSYNADFAALAAAFEMTRPLL